MIFNRRIKDRQKHGTLPFETLFHLSRYHFRFPRYHRIKKRIIFNLRPCCLLGSLARTSTLTYPKLQTSGRRDSWKKIVRISRKNEGRELIHNFTTVLNGHFESLYLSNQSSYQNKIKTDINCYIFLYFLNGF